MIARLVRTPFDREGWYFEFKWDGFRCIAEKNRQAVRLYSRNQNNFEKPFAVIAEQISAPDNVILDGEVCALDDHGHPSFEWLINRGRQRGKLVYYVFDLLRLGDKDLRAEPLYRRKKLLQKLLKKNDTLRYVDHVKNDGLHLFAGAFGPDARDKVRWCRSQAGAKGKHYNPAGDLVRLKAARRSPVDSPEQHLFEQVLISFFQVV